MEKITFVDNVTKANAETFNTMQDNIEDAIEEKQTYSTAEMRIGTWIDGKPIYRTVINAGTITATNTQVGTISNLSKLVSIKGTAHSSALSNQSYGIPNVHNDMSLYYINALINNGSEVRVRFGTGISQLEDVFIIVEYTKTTD